MLQVRRDLCLGCGLCIQNCPRQAISILWGKAEIDQSRCVPCRLCREVCPPGAIIEVAPVSIEELQTLVTALRQRTDDLIKQLQP